MTKFVRLPFRSTLTEYRTQAEELFEGFVAQHPAALDIVRESSPDFPGASDVRHLPFEMADAQRALARWYDFADWSRLVEYVEAVSDAASPVARFESAVEAVIHGATSTLKAALREDPELVRARSTRVTCSDPPVHRATLLHYVAANGVEAYRQIVPKNAVEIATILLEAGAEVDALADMYRGQCTTMGLLVSSDHPAKAGVQVALVDKLLDFGAAVDGRSPLLAALAFGHAPAAEALARRGARVDSLPAAAGLGRLPDVRKLLPTATAEDRHRALALAAQHGHVEIVRLLVDAGEDPNRYNPEGNHAHSTPLHQAVCSGHRAVAELLIERGAKLDVRDKVYGGTPLDWAVHERRPELADYLRRRGASDSGSRR